MAFLSFSHGFNVFCVCLGGVEGGRDVYLYCTRLVVQQTAEFAPKPRGGRNLSAVLVFVGFHVVHTRMDIVSNF